ncbi:MAG: MAC/perforin domain-containing protein [Jatrophihabitantaceae bacterium]
MSSNSEHPETATTLDSLRESVELDSDFLPGVEAIGAGYNPFLAYASTSSITHQIFDWNATPTQKVEIKGKSYLVPDLVDVQSDGLAYYSNSSGESINTFQTSLSTSVDIAGKYNYFSGSLSTEFSETSLTKSENSFSRIQQSINAWSLRLGVAGDLRANLRPDFRSYLDAIPCTADGAEELFNNYGSHFLTSVVMGGRAVLSSATDKLTVDHTYSVSVTAKATYESLTGQLSASEQTKYSESIESFTENSETNEYAIGGLQPQRAFDGKDGFDAWSSTVADAPDFVDFVPSVPIGEIWRLCADADQAAFLEQYYHSTWAPRVSASCQRYSDWVDQLVVVEGNSADTPAPTGYVKIPHDLNKGAHGKYIYLCKHIASYDSAGTNPECINDIQIIFGKNASAPAGYVKLPQDLNDGAGGDYIYLCYRPAAYSNTGAIKDVTVIGSGDANVAPPYDFEKVPGDLNKGAGGEYIYVCISRTG